MPVRPEPDFKFRPVFRWVFHKVVSSGLLPVHPRWPSFDLGEGGFQGEPGQGVDGVPVFGLWNFAVLPLQIAVGFPAFKMVVNGDVLIEPESTCPAILLPGFIGVASISAARAHFGFKFWHGVRLDKGYRTQPVC